MSAYWLNDKAQECGADSVYATTLEEPGSGNTKQIAQRWIDEDLPKDPTWYAACSDLIRIPVLEQHRSANLDSVQFELHDGFSVGIPCYSPHEVGGELHILAMTVKRALEEY
jgi:hypothetical protein